MNWERGFKRVWYFMLGLVWAGWIFASVIGHTTAAKVGEELVYMLVFSVGWQLFGAALLWVARGFSKDRT